MPGMANGKLPPGVDFGYSTRLRAVAVAAAAALAAVGTAAAARADASGPAFRPSGAPPAGKVLLGLSGPDPAVFDHLTGKHHTLHVLFGAWVGDVASVVSNEHAGGRLPILSLPASGTPAAVARGSEDARYLTLAAALHATGEDVWVRIVPEMNGSWNAWCAFDESGRPRGPQYAPKQFVSAFRRIAVILRGGSVGVINARLRAAGVRPLRAAAEDIPSSGKVEIVWNPQGHGTPFISANSPAAYWPGSGFVDIVADDLYSDSAEPSWQGMDTLYAYGKPFLVAEWALERVDDPAFAARLFTWVSEHPRTVGLVYFNKGWSGGTGIYELRTKPRSLAVYRQAIRNARYLSKLP
jgi:hypothetical protein